MWYFASLLDFCLIWPPYLDYRAPRWYSSKESTCQCRRSLCQEDPLEKEMTIHPRILAWRIPWTEEPAWLHKVHGVAESDTSEQVSCTHKSWFLVFKRWFFFNNIKKKNPKHWNEHTSLITQYSDTVPGEESWFCPTASLQRVKPLWESKNVKKADRSRLCFMDWWIVRWA